MIEISGIRRSTKILIGFVTTLSFLGFQNCSGSGSALPGVAGTSDPVQNPSSIGCTDESFNSGTGAPIASDQARLSSQKISTHSMTTCTIVEPSGEVRCWGANYYGQLGPGAPLFRGVPISIPGVINAVSVSVGRNAVCAVLSSGAIQCWGNNSSGQLGNGTTTSSASPVNVLNIANAIAVSITDTYGCAHLSSGQVKCWGQNQYGQLGDGTTTNKLSPVLVQGLSDVRELSVGPYHACAVRPSGEIQCWGALDRLSGQTPVASPSPTPVAGISGAVAVAVGDGSAYQYTCAVLSSGEIRCWGQNPYGNLGDQTFQDSLTPVAVKGVSTAVRAAGSFTHMCAILNAGQVVCWGNGLYGRLGNGCTQGSEVGVPVVGVSTAAGLTTSPLGVSCARLQDGQVKCWGSGKAGALGNGTESYSATAVTPPTFQTAGSSYADASGMTTACLVTSSKQVQCLGENSSYKLGTDTVGATATPLKVETGAGVTGVSVGNSHVCVALENGTVQCWGQNTQSQLGDQTKETRPRPVSVIGLTSAVQVVAGNDQTCAIVNSIRSVKCWGSKYGPVPISISSMSSVRSLALAGSKACAVLASGEVWCWSDISPSPTLMSGISGAVSITGAASNNFCVTTAAGQAACWGANSDRQINDTGSGVTIPYPIAGLNNVASVMSSYDGHVGANTCAIVGAGDVYCWGSNSGGQLGLSPLLETGVPTQIMGISDAAILFPLSGGLCAVQKSGGVKCWGSYGVNTYLPTTVTGL